jgi:hypothetical protein
MGTSESEPTHARGRAKAVCPTPLERWSFVGHHGRMEGRTSHGLAAHVAILLVVAGSLSGCFDASTQPPLGDPYECCSTARTGSEGEVGELRTCYRTGIDDYGAFFGHVACADDPTGRACVSVWLTRPPTPVRCFDPAGPAYEVSCCTDIGIDGRGRVGTCTCVLGERCASSNPPPLVPGAVCELPGVWPCRDDAACPIDAGAR